MMSNEERKMDETTTCPRCGGPADEHRTGLGFPRPGALSRWDSITTVCSACGTDEALLSYEAVQRGGVGAARAVLHPWDGARVWRRPPIPHPTSL